MDSMRHLSTSLPPASSRRSEPPSNILSDFKAAALSVTNLFKTAASAQTGARTAGYQDALDDLLAFLDKENLGLMDGEGWRVRQWATERLEGDGNTARQGGSTGTNMTDDYEDESSTVKDDEKDEERSSSPETQRKPQPSDMSESQPSGDDALRERRVVSEPPQAQELPPSLTSDFTFQSSHAYPTDHNRTSESGMELDSLSTPPPSGLTSSAPSSADTVRVVPRHSRGNRHTRRHEARLPPLNVNLGSGAGSKRKMPYPDFFDISGFHDGSERKDGSGSGRGGKRGKHA